MTNGDDSAFQDKTLDRPFPGNNAQERATRPLTKREYFAVLAMQGMLAWSGGSMGDSALNSSAWAYRAVSMADALIKVLNAQEGDKV